MNCESPHPVGVSKVGLGLVSSYLWGGLVNIFERKNRERKKTGNAKT
jgi:hypothetical protein